MNGQDLQHLTHLLHEMRNCEPVMHQEANGDASYKLWSGYLHRLDGPAIVRKDGTKEFWIYGRRCNSIADWAAAALSWQNKHVCKATVNEKVAEAMQQDLFDYER